MIPALSRPGRLLAWAAALLVLLGAGLAQAAPTFPPLTGRVVDNANILSPATEADLTAKLKTLEDKTGRQLVVATLPSLQGYEIEDYGYQLGRAWQLGQKGVNNGAILLVAPNERRVRVEVGYGLEGELTDALSSQIIQTAVLPRFKSGDMEGGVVAGTDALVDQLSLPDDQARQKVAAVTVQPVKTSQPARPWLGRLFLILVLFLILRMIFSRRRRGGGSAWWLAPIIFSGRGGGWSSGGGGGWSSGGGGGGGFSGGGGSFGGGGASGSW